MKTLYLLTSDVSSSYARALKDRAPTWCVVDAGLIIESQASEQQTIAGLIELMGKLDGKAECVVVTRMPQDAFAKLIDAGALVIDQRTIDVMVSLQPIRSKVSSPSRAILYS